MSAPFLDEEGRTMPLHSNQNFRAGILYFSKGTSRSAPGISDGVSTTLAAELELEAIAIYNSIVLVLQRSWSLHSDILTLLVLVLACDSKITILSLNVA